ncbi:hypothetical protein [Leptospirillum ferriphilum]|uniref:Uncharacterized protein n=1 Tax=Leptospirillum ferriphilum (strain ML-04) TaxID=1048260 RepID=J9Z9P5_LEPFM|nr:hypothetical protein [Leptospirillum ferriphilum]AFS52412.1 hypothetical protein LFML04_0162 [Leptospirillum ferriphilum ML-04]OOH83854.1 hypothetical protein BOX30_01095 [Leptospirillum ferriphilum]
MKKKLRILGALLLVSGIIPAGGPVYLGLIRDDIHAHSDLGDKGLQAITVSGILVLAAGISLLYLSTKLREDP